MMRILAIDPATKCGWAVSTKFYGMIDFKPQKDESSGFKLIKFKQFLLKTIKQYEIDLVVFERAGGRFKNDIMSHAKWIAIIEVVCIENNVEYRAYSSSQIKQFATGKGNSGKAEMVKAAIRTYKLPIKDDNIADALHLLHLAKRDIA